jgi:hypothetical protein
MLFNGLLPHRTFETHESRTAAIANGFGHEGFKSGQGSRRTADRRWVVPGPTRRRFRVRFAGSNSRALQSMPLRLANAPTANAGHRCGGLRRETHSSRATAQLGWDSSVPSKIRLLATCEGRQLIFTP